MAKRFSKKAKEQLIHDAIAEAIPALRLQHWQIEVFFQPDLDQRAYCEAEPQYRTAKVGFDSGRIRIFECVEFAVHELAHILTWNVASLLERSAGASEEQMKEATDAYESLTTEIGHIMVPLVMDKLKAANKLPPEAEETPNIIVVRDKKKPRKSGLDKLEQV